jgi:hypothetical protein
MSCFNLKICRILCPHNSKNNLPPYVMQLYLVGQKRLNNYFDFSHFDG